jgi:hypothetical protein
MTVNTKISTLVSSQLPAFVRDDHPLFVAFMEAYYEYLEQTVQGDTGSVGTGKVIERAKKLMDGRDIEKSMDDFTTQLYSEFLSFLPSREIDNSNTSNGVIVGTNYFRYSDGFNSLTYSLSNATKTANAGSLPSGAETATLVLEDSATSSHVLVAGERRPALGPTTWSFKIKPAGRTAGYIQYKDQGPGNDGYGFEFNLSPTGITSTGNPLTFGTYISNTVTVESNGWYKIALTGNSTAAITNTTYAIFTKQSYLGSVTHSGDPTKGFLVGDFQIEPGTKATIFTPTSNSQINPVTGARVPTYTYEYPKTLATDYKKLLPKIKDFYRARGTEKSYKFLMRLLTDGGESEILYPKDHILKASDGKWIIQKSLRVTATKLNGNSDNSLATFALYEGRQLQGVSSNTTASVERVEQFYELGTLINEIYLSSISNTFTSGEVVRTQYYDTSNNLVTLTSNIFSGLVSSIVVGTGGSGYAIGNPVTFTGGDGSGAAAVVSSVSTGNVSGMQVVRGGSGYQQNNFLLFSGGGGSGANGSVLTVNNSGVFHPNTYNIDANQISQIQSATWGAAQTIFARTTANLALNVISTLASTFTYSNCGPATIVQVLAPGTGYTSVPTISIIANTSVAPLGILGSLIINSGGASYSAGDELVFTNPPEGYGFGAKANVMSVNGTGAITRVRYYTTSDNEVAGGLGYFDGYLPSITVASGAGVGANITAASQIASGASITPTTGAIGTILGVTITSGGQGYTTAPVATLPGYGDGTANLSTSVVQGIFTYPGYFLNQDGFPSAYNYIQDRDYWQNYSYVVRVGLAYEKWITAVRNLLHPSGIRVWGDYALVDDITINTSDTSTGNTGTENRLDYYLNTGQSNTIIFHGNNGIILYDSYIIGSNVYYNQAVSLWINFPNYIANDNAQMTLVEIANSSWTGGVAAANNGNNKVWTVYIGKERTVMGYNEWANSESMVSPEWNVITSGVSALALDSVLAPDGTMTGDIVYEDTNLTQHQMGRLSTNMTSRSLYTFSQYFKPVGNTTNVQLRWSVAVGTQVPSPTATIAFFGLSGNGSVGTLYNTNNAKIELANNGWYRCQMTGITGNTPSGTGFVLIRACRGETETYTGDTSSGLAMWGAQLEPTNYEGAGPCATPPMVASRYVKTGIEGGGIIYANAQEELSGTGHYIGVNFANNLTGELLYHARTNSVTHPLQTNTWYHFVSCLDTNSQKGPFGEGLPIHGMFLNNSSSCKIIRTTQHRIPQEANLNGITLFSLGSNTTGQNTYTGNISEFYWMRYGGVSTQLPEIRRCLIRPRQLAPNLDIMIGGTSQAGYSNGLFVTAKYYFRANTVIPLTAKGAPYLFFNSGFGAPAFAANGTGVGGLSNPMLLAPQVVFGGGPGSTKYY